jgi:hypothetical protein
MEFNRRALILGGLAGGSAGLLLAQVRTGERVFRPEDFGARGDGRTNDTEAFVALSQAVNLAGGGTIALRPVTYVVGRQTLAVDAAQPWAFNPSTVIDLRGLSRPLVIEGNGACLRADRGLRFGTFDRRSGEPVTRPMPNFRQEELGVPYDGMVNIAECTASVEIADLELDGSLPRLRIGGPFGDTGHQVPATGLMLRDNRGPEIVRNLHTHHHGTDGIMIGGDDRRRTRSRFEQVRSEYNGRQGLSLIGGRGYDFVDCRFSHQGLSAIQSMPGAGVDLEAEGGKIVRDFTFTDCEFADNFGCGMLAGSGDVADGRFVRCRFIGSRNWSAWPSKPGLRFDDCLFVGAMVNAHPDEDPSRAARFHGCTFLDDPARSSGGRVYLRHGSHGAIADLDQGTNVLFDRCAFRLTHQAELPWSIHAVYRDCIMSQRSELTAYPRGTYYGRTVINGNVDLQQSVIRGEVIVNGQRRT